MSSRPRRSAAQKASVAITDMADRDNMSSSRSRRAGDGLASVSRGPQGGNDHTYLTVKVPSSKLRQATSSRQGSSIAVNSDSAPKRSTRGGKKSYVVESDSDDDEEEGEDEIQVGAPAGEEDDDDDEDMDDVGDDVEDDDAEGEDVEDEMDVDADGEDDEDAEGDEDDVAPPPGPVIKISKPGKKSPESKKTKNATPQKATVQFSAPNDSDDDELSELESDEELEIEGEDDAEGDEEDEDMDAEGDEVEDNQEAGAGPERDAEAAPGRGDLGSDDDLSAGGTPDFSRMTVRQRARFEEVDSSHYQALSNEVQAKKHFTAEEKAMRRAEMARRRRNLSEKRNEEVKQETINKLLKKQAGKTNRKNLQSIGEEEQDADGFRRPNPVFIRWISSKEGERIAVPGDILEGPAGRLFAGAVRPSGAGPTGLAAPKKMVEEVS